MKPRQNPRFVGVLLTVIVAATGCSLDPSTISIPGTGASGPTYRLHVHFANALNLPGHAKVVANGVQVGELDRVTIVPPTRGRAGYVSADIDVEKAVKLPTTTTAQLRQTTLLGDIYIALRTPPTDFAHTLAGDQTIPLAQTQPALQVEDAMAGLATFVQGGGVNQMQAIVRRVNAVLPQNPTQTARIFDTIGSDITDVSQHLRSVDSVLDGITSGTQLVLDDIGPLHDLLTPEGAAQVTRATTSISKVIGIFVTMSSVAKSLVWLKPFLQGANAAAQAFIPLAFTNRPLDLDAPSNLHKLVSLLHDKIIPFASHPTVAVTGVKISPASAPRLSADDQTTQMITALTMIGAVR